MALSGLAIAVVALLGWIWLTRGFFSAFLNLICCVAAGAIAFAVWEPIAYMLLGKIGGNDALGGTIWAISLGLPFAVAMALLRAVVDQCCPSNMKFDTVTDAVGGAACGVGAGIITAGILVISMGFLRVERTFMGHNPVTFQSNGSLKTDKGLILPVDTLTSRLYRMLSNGSLSTSTPLAAWYPDLEYVPHSIRLSFGRGKARNTINTKDFEVWKRFRVGGEGVSFSDVLRDDWEPQVSQSVSDIDGSPFPSGSALEGFVLNFQPSSRERSGSVVIGNAQVRLLIEKPGAEPEHRIVHPVSVISQATSERVGFARFRFNVPDTFITSVGGASETRMGFEFPVPPGFQAKALYVKNTRVVIPPENKPIVYPTAAARDAEIRSGKMFALPVDYDTITPIRTTVASIANRTDQELGIMVSPGLGFTIQRGTERGLTTEDVNVIEGQEVYEIRMFDKTRGIDRNLRIDQFQTKSDTVIVQISVGGDRPLTWLRKVPVVETTPAPQLVDTDGQVYEAIGYIYDEQNRYRTIRFNRSRPIRLMSDLPSMSAQREDQKMTLIYDVSRGVRLAKFQMGGTVLHEFKPPMNTVDR
ncbi:MAG: hypothetical protein KF787_03695 [Phycisphaeraceae bacterium]|nr:hypothetical protein [Phycisphaerae bacterium]MBX3391731.1 hypothetical protein [Phycisphaeraceae bacterium]